MAARRSSRACPGRLPLLVALALGLAAPAWANDPAPAVATDPAGQPRVAISPGTGSIVAPVSEQAGPGPVATASPAMVKPVPSALPSAAPTAALPEKAGDRADAIAQDVVLHPPQKPMPEAAASSLRTMKLRLGALLDRSVHGPEDTEVGHVIDVLLGEDGKPAALEMDVGGFMGVGNRKIVVAWALFDIPKPASTDPIRLSLTDAQVKSAPSAEESGDVTVVTGVVPHVVAAASAPPAKPAVPPSAIVTAPVAPVPVVPAPAMQPPVQSIPGTATHPPGGQP